jgi:hypothetical protein
VAELARVQRIGGRSLNSGELSYHHPRCRLKLGTTERLQYHGLGPDVQIIDDEIGTMLTPLPGQKPMLEVKTAEE